MAETLDLNSLSEVLNLPFPAQTKQVAGKINGVLTDVLSIGFSDKILVTVSQEGRLAHWVCPISVQATRMKTNHLFSSMFPLRTTIQELMVSTLFQKETQITVYFLFRL